MAPPQRFHVARIAATDYAANGDVCRAQSLDDMGIARPKACIGKRQPAETILVVRINPGIEENQIRSGKRQGPVERRCQNFYVGIIAGAVRKIDIKVTGYTPRRVVAFALDGQREDMRGVPEDVWTDTT